MSERRHTPAPPNGSKCGAQHRLAASARGAAGLPAGNAVGLRGAGRGQLRVYSCFDLLGRHYTGHRLGTRTVMVLTFVSYTFNLNLGSIAVQLRLIGASLLALALAYLGACALSRQRIFCLRGHAIELPSLRLAGLQLAMGAGNWLLMSGILFMLFEQRVDFFSVVGMLLLLAAIAGVIAHIPGNLGVLEAVFVALLSHRLPPHEVLAALVAYRIVYYLIPLGLATLIYLALKARARRQASPARQRKPPLGAD